MLVALESDYEAVVDARGLSLMSAIEFETADERDDVMYAALQRGLLTIGCGRKSLRLLPPLDVRDRELTIADDILTEVIADVTTDTFRR